MLQLKRIQRDLAAFISTSMLISGSVALSDMPDQSAYGTSQDYQTLLLGKSIDFNAFIDAGCFSDGYNLDCSDLGFDHIWLLLDL